MSRKDSSALSRLAYFDKVYLTRHGHFFPSEVGLFIQSHLKSHLNRILTVLTVVQFGRLAGSTTAAIVSILHTITHLLTTNPYVVVIALDFSKAFDTVRHCTLLEKLGRLDIDIVVVALFALHCYSAIRLSS